jgi:hypothetical protein
MIWYDFDEALHYHFCEMSDDKKIKNEQLMKEIGNLFRVAGELTIYIIQIELCLGLIQLVQVTMLCV